MNDASASSAPGSTLLPDGIATITTLHFAVIGVLAVLIVIGIIWGSRLKRSRVKAREQVETHAEEAGVPVLEPGETADEVPETATPASPAPAPAPAPRDTNVATEATPARDYVEEPVFASGATMPAPAATIAAADGDPADGPVTLLKGLGPKVAAQLAERGITTVGQLASLSPADAQALDAQLGSFTGRMNRDRWIEQARFLAAGDQAGFEAVFGKL